MERICEIEMSSEYYTTQHFISESPWSHREVMDKAAEKASAALSMSGSPVALLIDESGHAKKGRQSVGVARQYSGTLGKVDNCQVAVYCSLSSGKYYSLIDTALYLPKEWTNDADRCKKAGIPTPNREYKTKLELALDMIERQQQAGIRFDYVGGDGLYGNNYALMEALSHKGITAVFDIHRDQFVFTEPPVLYVSENKGAKGRKATRVKTQSIAITVQDFHQTLSPTLFEQVTIRQGTKGSLNSSAYYQTVYVWDGTSVNYQKRTLLIRCTDGVIKYAFTNADITTLSLQQLVAMQAQRYFIERSFQECKQDIGLSDYQVRGWLAWHHHIALCIMAQGYILQEKLLAKEVYPLLSAYDIRQVIINTYARKNGSYQILEEQIRKRHTQRNENSLFRINRSD